MKIPLVEWMLIWFKGNFLIGEKCRSPHEVLKFGHRHITHSRSSL